MATANSFQFKTEKYLEQRRFHWPTTGRHILAQFDDELIIVYQAFCPEIADYAVQHGKFGGPRYSFTRMTWIKTNFLWMMYRSNWAQKKNQDRILAVYISREGFDQILKFSKGTGIRVEGRTPGNVRIQWDPDHDPNGENQRRRAVQLGIKGIPLQRFHEQYIHHIEDITDFVKQQRQHVLKNELDKLVTPVERVYRPTDEEICKHILLDDFTGSKNDYLVKTSLRTSAVTKETFSENNGSKQFREDEDVSDINEGACSKELLASTKLEAVREGRKKELIVCLGGSFNPVHSGHIQLIETAIRCLANSNYNVVAARLAVAPDSYVKNKCKRKGGMCIKAAHRIKLCELACKGHKLIQTYYTTISCAYNCAENVRKWENLQNAKVAEVTSSDKVMSRDGHWRWQSNGKCLTVCVARRGTADIIRKAYHEHYNDDISSNPDFLMIEDELADVNSDEITRHLSKVDVSFAKYASNNETEIRHTDVVSSKELEPQNEKVDDGTISSTDRAVPTSWENLIDQKIQPAKNTAASDININEGTDPDIHLTRRERVLLSLMSKGWLDKSVGNYISKNCSDLFL